MIDPLFASPFSIAAAVLGLAGSVFVVAALFALFRLRPLRFVLHALAAGLLLALGALAGTVALGIQGYRALTHEELAATLKVRPVGAQRFEATLRYPDGREARFDLAGDEVYVDARIVKWKPLANLLGLHTAYELDRIAGRYRDIGQERSAPRTIHALGRTKPVDVFQLRRRYEFLGPVLDAQYGSASFVPVTREEEMELRVSSTGLLIRTGRSTRDAPSR